MGIPVDYCEPWTTPERLCCPDATATDCGTGEEVPVTYAWTDDELIEAASGMLFRATCGLFPGHCELTVRPCVRCGCGRWPCGCGRYRFVDLQDRFPVISVESVLIDGEEVDPATYRLDDYRRLVRLGADVWPTCNDLALPSTDPGTFEVRYIAGRRPPIELQMAAAELTCELKRACNGLACRLPANVTRVTRNGITLEIGALEDALRAGVSGVAMVDAAIRRYDCTRAKARVWHPGLRQARQIVTTPAPPSGEGEA